MEPAEGDDDARDDDARDDDWRSLSRADLERQYSPSSCIGGDIGPLIEAYATRSESARQACKAAGLAVEEIYYGSKPAQTVDLVSPVPTGELTPLLVFIHGGYWQELSKIESFFAASDSLAHDVAFAAVDYTLAPHASLDEIVGECRDALSALREVANDHHIDPERIVVCGSSAGGHLAAMMGLCLADGWRPAALGLVSGVFELEPLIGTYINDAVQLDVSAAHRNSPLMADLAGFPPCLIAHGANETDEFKRQSADFAAALADSGTAVQLVEIDGRNHFDVILGLCDDQTDLGRHILDLIDQTASGR